MAWDEWEQMKAAALDHQSARMQLNQAPGGTKGSASGGKGSLRSDKKAWNTAGAAVSLLADNIKNLTTGGPLDKSQRPFDDQEYKGQNVCETAMTQGTVHYSWMGYLNGLWSVCDELADIMKKTGNGQLQTDADIKAGITQVNSQYYEKPLGVDDGLDG